MNKCKSILATEQRRATVSKLDMLKHTIRKKQINDRIRKVKHSELSRGRNTGEVNFKFPFEHSHRRGWRYLKRQTVAHPSNSWRESSVTNWPTVNNRVWRESKMDVDEQRRRLQAGSSETRRSWWDKIGWSYTIEAWVDQDHQFVGNSFSNILSPCIRP